MPIDVRAVTDQKIAVGLIENGLRDCLIDLASKVPAGQAVVELGSYRGRSTGHLALGVERGGKGVKVHAVDPWEQRTDYAPAYVATAVTVADYSKSETRLAFEAHLQSSGAAAHVEVHQGLGVNIAETWDGPPVGLLFHDALHTEAEVFGDLKSWLPHMAEKAVVVLHDVGDPRYQVEKGAGRAFTRTKALRETWDWGGREIHLWPKQPTRRGYLIVRTK